MYDRWGRGCQPPIHRRARRPQIYVGPLCCLPAADDGRPMSRCLRHLRRRLSRPLAARRIRPTAAPAAARSRRPPAASLGRVPLAGGRSHLARRPPAPTADHATSRLALPGGAAATPPRRSLRPAPHDPPAPPARSRRVPGGGRACCRRSVVGSAVTGPAVGRVASAVRAAAAGRRPGAARARRPPGRACGRGVGRWPAALRSCAASTRRRRPTVLATAASTSVARPATSSLPPVRAWLSTPACWPAGVSSRSSTRAGCGPPTSRWRSPSRRGAAVSRGRVLGRLLGGHAGCPWPACLHWGLRRGETYLDPLSLLRRGPVRLLPLHGEPWPTPWRPRRAAVPRLPDRRRRRPPAVDAASARRRPRARATRTQPAVRRFRPGPHSS